MEWMKSWLFSIVCAAMVAAVADALSPKGFPKQLARYAGGLLVLMAVLGPVKRLDSDVIGDITANLKGRYGGYAETFAHQNTQVTKAIIEEETAAYISDKAAGLGITQCRAEVRCRMTEEGFPAPETVRVEGCGDETAWQALSRAITADFAIEPEAQTLKNVSEAQTLERVDET